MENLPRIRDILNAHVGRANRITSSEIANLLGIEEDDTKVRTRALILECAKTFNIPLAAGNHGYFVIETEEEFNDYMRNLDSRIAGINERKKIITDNFRRRNNEV